MAQVARMSDDEFVELQQWRTAQGYALRVGDTDWDKETTRESWQGYAIPYNTGAVQFDWDDPDALPLIEDAQAQLRTKFMVRDPSAISQVEDPKMRDKIKTQFNAALRLAWNCGLRYVGVLASGGFGLAAIVEFQHTNGDWRPYVLKIPFTEDQLDMGVMKELARAEHIVQRVSVRVLNHTHGRGFLPGARPANAQQQAQGVNEPAAQPYEQDLFDFDNHAGLLLMEYCTNGDLGQAIARSKLAADKQKKTGSLMREPIIWRMFDCLVKSAIALAFPPIHQPQPDSIHPYGPPITERVPPVDQRTFFQYCHFDIDPNNIFVGEVDQGDHDDVPIFKLGDFGTTYQIDTTFEEDDPAVWNARGLGKNGNHAPEQWTAYWDTVFDNPRNEGVPVAGHYGWATNVYQIGAAIFSVIAGFGVPFPPLAKPFRVPVDGPNGDEVEDRLTLGWELLQDEKYNDLSLELRELVVDCLSHDPRHRPSPEELSREIAQGIQSQIMTDELRAIVRSTYLVGIQWKPRETPYTPDMEIEPDDGLKYIGEDEGNGSPKTGSKRKTGGQSQGSKKRRTF